VGLRYQTRDLRYGHTGGSVEKASRMRRPCFSEEQIVLRKDDLKSEIRIISNTPTFLGRETQHFHWVRIRRDLDRRTEITLSLAKIIAVTMLQQRS
jgi:hypothetical protein